MLRDLFPGIALEGKIYSIIWAEIFFKNWAQPFPKNLSK